MRLDLSHIRQAETAFLRQYEPSGFAGDDEDYRVVAPVSLGFTIHKDHDRFRLVGSVATTLELACSRCLTRYRGPIRERFRLVLEPAGDRVPADPEGAAALAHEGLYLADELESGWFRGTEIQLDRFVGEMLALAVPVQPLCREDCRGLCPRCGVDRNVESCSCSEARPESPFAVLASLRSPDRK